MMDCGDRIARGHRLLFELADMMTYAMIAVVGLDLNAILPIAAGVGTGLAVVGLIHFFRRGRKQAAPVEQKPAKPADPFVHGSANEKRKSFRRKGNPIHVQVIDQATESQPVTGMVINRSVGGLCLQLDRPLSINAELTVRPTNAPHIAPWVEVVVRNCREGEIGYEVGCQFVKTPPWPVLMMFG